MDLDIKVNARDKEEKLLQKTKYHIREKLRLAGSFQWKNSLSSRTLQKVVWAFESKIFSKSTGRILI